MERKKNSPLTLNDKVELIRQWKKLKLTLHTIEHLVEGVEPKLIKSEEYEILTEVLSILDEARIKLNKDLFVNKKYLLLSNVELKKMLSL
jgi:hypothetical protein